MSELLSKVVETEGRRHLLGHEHAVYDSVADLDEDEVDEAVRAAEIQAKLIAEQEAGEAVAAAAAETEKKCLENALRQEGASAEEKEVMACGLTALMKSSCHFVF